MGSERIPKTILVSSLFCAYNALSLTNILLNFNSRKNTWLNCFEESVLLLFSLFTQNYLMKYGYLSHPDHIIGKRISMEEFIAAVKKMQRFVGLKETGDISDPKTLALAKHERCGVPDFGSSENMWRKRRYALERNLLEKTSK